MFLMQRTITSIANQQQRNEESIHESVVPKSSIDVWVEALVEIPAKSFSSPRKKGANLDVVDCRIRRGLSHRWQPVSNDAGYGRVRGGHGLQHRVGRVE